MNENTKSGLPQRSLKEAILFELEPKRLIPNINAGFVVSIIVVFVAVSLATLIFSGELEVHLDEAISLMLFSGILITGIVSIGSSYRGMLAYPQERVAPILAVIATAAVAQLSGKVPTREMFFTVVAAISLASLATGIFLLALGFFKLGALIRFIPYPVIGGFLAGTGWLLVRGSIGVTAGFHIHASDIPRLFEGAIFAKWITGVFFGSIMVMVTRRITHFLTMPTLLLGTVALFYLILFSTGITAEVARSNGWLLGPFPDSDPWKPLTFAAFSQADWSVILGQSVNIATIILIAVISVLMNSGALELVAKTDIDLNHEVKILGASPRHKSRIKNRRFGEYTHRTGRRHSWVPHSQYLAARSQNGRGKPRCRYRRIRRLCPHALARACRNDLFPKVCPRRTPLFSRHALSCGMALRRLVSHYKSRLCHRRHDPGFRRTLRIFARRRSGDHSLYHSLSGQLQQRKRC